MNCSLVVSLSAVLRHLSEKYADLFWDLADGSLRMFLNYRDLHLVAQFIEECLLGDNT